MMTDKLLMGAVAYDPKVVTIWDGFKTWFCQRGLPFDYVLYSNYEQQVEAHARAHIHIAWNSPLAWLQTRSLARRQGRKAQAVAMRDTDQDLSSVIVSRADSDIRTIEDLRGRTVGVGATDSPQATLIPMLHLTEAGLQPNVDFLMRPFDTLPGKHGDHVGGERDAANALLQGEVDAACMIDGNHLQFVREGTLAKGATRIIAQTALYDHCNFTAFEDGPADHVKHFCNLLRSMRHDDPEVRHLLDLEGLTEWRRGRTDRYGLLERAVDSFGTIDQFVADLANRCT